VPKLRKSKLEILRENKYEWFSLPLGKGKKTLRLRLMDDVDDKGKKLITLKDNDGWYIGSFQVIGGKMRFLRYLGLPSEYFALDKLKYLSVKNLVN
jgi:hypothetical protein